MPRNNINGSRISWMVKYTLFVVLPLLALIKFISEFILLQKTDLDLDFYYLICAVPIAILSIELVLLKNKIIKNTTSHLTEKFGNRNSLYLSLTFYASFIAMSVLNYLGLEQYVTAFYILIVIYGLSFYGVLRLELNYEKKHIPTESESTE